MNKHLVKVLLCGAMILSAGTFTSCGNDDLSDLEGRVSVLEVAVEDVVKNALVTGASVINPQQNEDGSWTISLSDGKTIAIPAPSTGGGGSNITVTITDTEAIFVIDGVEYKLPLGASVSSLVYSPDYVDGLVMLGNEGAEVKFLARPALTSIDGAKFTIAESHELQTRAADGEDFAVTGAVIDGEFVKLTIVGIGAAASSTHAVSVQMELKGTVIGSNYFTIEVSEDFEFKAEDIDPAIQPKAAYSPVSLADGFVEMTVNGADFSDVTNFRDLFDGVPADAEFVIAPNAAQPGGDAQAKQGVLAGSLAADGTWALTERLGTSFNGGDRKGFLVYVRNADLQIKAKIWVMINDELADVDFSSQLTPFQEQHMEYGIPTAEGVGVGEGEGGYLAPGVNRVNIASVLLNGEISLAHGSTVQFLEALENYSVKLGEEPILSSDGYTLITSDLGKSYAKSSRGLLWTNRQMSIVSSNRRNWPDIAAAADDAAKMAIVGGICNGEIINGWDGVSAEDMTTLGIKITEDGYIETTAAYKGEGFRCLQDVVFEYDYGTKRLTDAGFAFIFFGRRNLAEGVMDVAAR